MDKNTINRNIEDYVVEFSSIPYDRVSIPRILTGYEDLDYYLKGLEVGLTELVGDTDVGKSTIVSKFLDCAIRQDCKAGVFAGEHTLGKYKMLLMQQNGRMGEFELIPFIDKYGIYQKGNETNIADWHVNKEVEHKVNKKYENNLYLFNTKKIERDIDTLCFFIENCNSKFGVKFFVIDNFMEIENNKNNQYQEEGSITSKIRNIALRLGLFIILVMHTNKTSGADGFRLTLRNAFGSSLITNKGYNVLALYRKDKIFVNNKQDRMLDKFKQDCAKCGFDYDTCDGFIEVLKTKGNCYGIVGLIYDKENKTYQQAQKISNTEADKKYRIYGKQEEFNYQNNDLIPIDDDITNVF